MGKRGGGEEISTEILSQIITYEWQESLKREKREFNNNIHGVSLNLASPFDKHSYEIFAPMVYKPSQSKIDWLLKTC